MNKGVMHTIRLRQPWETTETAAGTTLVRRFHKPTGLDAGERAYLVIAATPGLLAVRLNGEIMEMGSGSFRCDITARLLPRNELSLDLPPSGTLGEVCLQILNPQS